MHTKTMRKLIVILSILALVGVSHATRLERISTDDLFARADHVFTGKVIKIELIDRKSGIVQSEDSPTGSRSGNKIRMSIEIYDVIKTTAKTIPNILTIEYRSALLTSMKERKQIVGWKRIFFLSGEKFHPVSLDQFSRSITTIKK